MSLHVMLEEIKWVEIVTHVQKKQFHCSGKVDEIVIVLNKKNSIIVE
jgi:16S rRNA A1518/A1519 N6-dimethyltransferase RsmA/KsgA/DIM1 with predicted DNA glycosylase/AP lyase activity